jgi:hypothetical protein
MSSKKSQHVGGKKVGGWGGHSSEDLLQIPEMPLIEGPGPSGGGGEAHNAKTQEGGGGGRGGIKMIICIELAQLTGSLVFIYYLPAG